MGGNGVNCEPAWLPFGPTSVVPLAVCQAPAGEGRKKTWGTVTAELRHSARPSPAARALWERLAPTGISQLCGGSEKVGGLLPIWALLRPCSKVWGPSLWSLQTNSSQCLKMRAGPRVLSQ